MMQIDYVKYLTGERVQCVSKQKLQQELSSRLRLRDPSSSYTSIGVDSATRLVILVPPTVPIDNPQAPSQACPCTLHDRAPCREL